MIVAVTGANGFIGRHLCAAIERRGDEVRRVVRRDLSDDARLHAAFAGAEVVIHAAAATRAPTHAELRRSNIDLTSRVVGAAHVAGARRLLYVSSQAAAGPARTLDHPLSEDDAPRPVEEYGRTKLAGEVVIRDGRVPFTIVRPSAVYGPGDRDFLPLIALARRGIAIHPGNRDQWISIVHVDDCVDAILRAATTECAVGNTYFIAGDEPVQWSTLFRLAAAAAGSRLWLDLEIPRPLVGAGAFIGDLIARTTGTAGLLTTEKVRLSRDPFWVCTNARARAELAFAPRVALADALRALVNASAA